MKEQHKLWKIYLSGEIHSDWRNEIISFCHTADLPVQIWGPEMDHETSDDCGEKILGKETSAFWKDHKAAKINSIRTRTLIKESDIVVVRFGDKYRQWNAAFDAGMAAAYGKSLISLHDEALDHALKEVDASALAVARKPFEVVEILRYITNNS